MAPRARGRNAAGPGPPLAPFLTITNNPPGYPDGNCDTDSATWPEVGEISQAPFQEAFAGPDPKACSLNLTVVAVAVTAVHRTALTSVRAVTIDPS